MATNHFLVKGNDRRRVKKLLKTLAEISARDAKASAFYEDTDFRSQLIGASPTNPEIQSSFEVVAIRCEGLLQAKT